MSATVGISSKQLAGFHESDALSQLILNKRVPIKPSPKTESKTAHVASTASSFGATAATQAQRKSISSISVKPLSSASTTPSDKTTSLMPPSKPRPITHRNRPNHSAAAAAAAALAPTTALKPPVQQLGRRSTNSGFVVNNWTSVAKENVPGNGNIHTDSLDQLLKKNPHQKNEQVNVTPPPVSRPIFPAQSSCDSPTSVSYPVQEKPHNTPQKGVLEAHMDKPEFNAPKLFQAVLFKIPANLQSSDDSPALVKEDLQDFDLSEASEN